ncbi:MAG TPA: hypothetical protein VI588_02400, partial [Candidatus Gracilibacteria bacterium]|nr:hypothetical protein [Candidatus Gracilibacteria bacterium]
DAGAVDTAIQFGNDAVASENGVITWNITTNTFEVDHTVDITGGLSADGNVNFSGASEMHVREEADEAAADCTTVDEIILDTTENRFYVCTVTGSPGTWQAADSGSADDFESVYGNDADDTLTTSGGNFTVTSGGGNVNLGLGAGEFDVTSTGLIDFNVASFELDTTGAFSISGGADSDITTTGAFDITLSAGDDLFFDDAQLGAAIQLTDTATGIAGTYGTSGIIDALNTLTTTTSGEGASNVGIEDTGGFFTGADVESALQELGADTGANAANTEVLIFHPEYPDAVIFSDGTTNTGTLISDYDDANDENYYRWRGGGLGALQDIDLRFRFPLPADFTDVNDFTYRFRTDSTVAGDNNLNFTVFNATDETAGSPTSCATDTTNTSAVAATWETGTITEASIETGCTGATALDAGDIIEVLVKLLDNSGAADAALAGYLSLGYDN